MPKYKIFTGRSHPTLAQAVAKHCKQSLDKIELKEFPCGEIYVRFIETVRGQEVFLLQTCRTQYMHQDLMELLLMIDAARQSFASQINVIIPYLAYSRQDKIHEPREGISAKLVARLLAEAGADHLITMHLHADQIQGFFDVPLDNLTPRKLLVNFFKAKNLANHVVVSPDVGGAKLAKKFADELKLPLAIIQKHRPQHSEAIASNIIGDVAGKKIILIDDIVDGGSSVISAHQALIDAKSSPDISLCFTHPVLSGSAKDRLTKANFKEIVSTDTLPVDIDMPNYKSVSIAPLLADIIKNIVTHKPLSALHIN